MNQNNNEERSVNEIQKDSGTGVIFDEKHKIERVYHFKTPKITQLIMKYSGGYISNTKEANYVLLALCILAIISSFVLIFNSGDGIPSTPIEYSHPDIQ